MTQTNDEAPSTGKRGGGLNVWEVLDAIKRRPLTLLAVAVVAVGAGAAVRFLLPLPKTTVTTVFHISPQAPVLLNQTIESRVDFASYRQAQTALVKRRPTLKSVLKQPAVQKLDVVRMQSDPLDWLDNATKVKFQNGNELMQVSIEGDSVDELRTILEALIKAYLADVDDQDHGTRRRRLDKLNDAFRENHTELERFQKRIEKIAIELGSKDGPTLVLLDSSLKEDLRAALRELSVIRDQIQLADIELVGAGGAPLPHLPGAPAGGADDKGGRDPLPAAAPPSEVDEELRRDTGLKDLEAKVVLARQTLSGTKALFAKGERPPAVVAAEADLAEAEQRRDRYRDELRPLIETMVRKKNAQAEQGRLAAYRTMAVTLKKREELAKARVAEIQKVIAKANDYTAELETIRSAMSQTEKLNTRLADEIDQIKLELGAPSRVTLAEEPYIVPGIEGNRRMKYTLFAALGVLCVGFGGVVLWEHRTRRLIHSDEVTTVLGIRLIGTVPAIAPGPGARGDPSPVLVEAIDATRTMLLNGAGDSDLRVLVVTSAVSGEGKTSLSGHLAISLARAGFRTLLVDGDLRAPTAQRVFGLGLAPGLCEVLRGEVGGAAAARPTGVPNLWVLTAGEWCLSARQALAGNAWRAAKEQLKAAFDYVVVDTSPLLMVSDALLLAREADGVLVSVLVGVSQVSLVDEAVNRLRAIRANVTGVIASGGRSVAHEYMRRPESPDARSVRDPAPPARG